MRFWLVIDVLEALLATLHMAALHMAVLHMAVLHMAVFINGASSMGP